MRVETRRDENGFLTFSFEEFFEIISLNCKKRRKESQASEEAKRMRQEGGKDRKLTFSLDRTVPTTLKPCSKRDSATWIARYPEAPVRRTWSWWKRTGGRRGREGSFSALSDDLTPSEGKELLLTLDPWVGREKVDMCFDRIGMEF